MELVKKMPFSWLSDKYRGILHIIAYFFVTLQERRFSCKSAPFTKALINSIFA